MVAGIRRQSEVGLTPKHRLGAERQARPGDRPGRTKKVDRHMPSSQLHLMRPPELRCHLAGGREESMEVESRAELSELTGSS